MPAAVLKKAVLTAIPAAPTAPRKRPLLAATLRVRRTARSGVWGKMIHAQIKLIAVTIIIVMSAINVVSKGVFR